MPGVIDDVTPTERQLHGHVAHLRELVTRIHPSKCVGNFTIDSDSNKPPPTTHNQRRATDYRFNLRYLQYLATKPLEAAHFTLYVVRLPVTLLVHSLNTATTNPFVSRSRRLI